MFLTALTWPEASVRTTLITAVAVVLGVLVWSILRTGQTAIRKDAALERRRAGQPES